MKAWKLACIFGMSMGSLLVAMLVATAGSPTPSDSYARLMREAALMLLKEGNARFISGQSRHPNLDVDRRIHTFSEGQEPLAAILSCSDSRVPVEPIFDRGIGDLFVVRVAGNVAGQSELASLEYAVGHLKIPLVVVMGHTRCGAVTAVVKGAEMHGHLPRLAEKIRPAATRARLESNSPDETVPRAIEANVWQAITEIISQSAEIRASMAAGKVQLVGGIYDLELGAVNWLGTHPGQDLLLKSLAGKKPAKEPASTDAEDKSHVATPGSAPHDSAKGHSSDAAARTAAAAPVPAEDKKH